MTYAALAAVDLENRAQPALWDVMLRKYLCESLLASFAGLDPLRHQNRANIRLTAAQPVDRFRISIPLDTSSSFQHSEKQINKN